MVLVIDFGSGPVKDTELVAGSGIGEGKGDGSGPGKIGGGGVEEEVAYELLVGGVRRGVDGDEIEVGGGLDVRPLDSDRVVGFGEGFGGN